MATVKVDLKEIESLRQEIRRASIVGLGRLGERLYQHLRAEVPYQTGNLRQGVAPPEIDESKMTATVTVSARSARTGGGEATVHYPSGKTKRVTLRPTVPFNYAEVVARGNKNSTVYPKKAKAMLIPVVSPPADEAYITLGDKVFIVRKSRKGQKPNPFDERAAARLEAEAPRIVGAVFNEFFR